MINPKLTTGLDSRWPQGHVGSRVTRVVKNARIYVATPDQQVIKIGWGDLDLEQWHLLREITADGIGLVAAESAYGMPSSWYRQSEAADATLELLIPGLVLALDQESVVLLNHADPDRHVLGALSLPAIGRQETPSWLAARLAELTRPIDG